MSKAITLIILDYNLFKDDDFYYNTHRYTNTRTGRELTDLAEIRYLELQKLRLGEAPKTVENLNQLKKEELWALFLSTESEEVLDLLAEKDKDIENAVEKPVILSAEDIGLPLELVKQL